MSVKDPLGHHLLKSRITQCSEIIQGMLEAPIQATISDRAAHFTVTGIGSSEAHAKFFMDLINRYTPSSATFLNLSNFYTILPKTPKEKKSILVVFSQGISPNALLAINQRHLFKELILFTSITATDLQSPRANLIKTLKIEGHTVIEFPLENEYTLLIRIIGPLAGYLAVIQFINHNWHECIKLLPYNNSDLIQAIKNADNNIPKSAINILEKMKQGSVFLMPAPLCLYAQNLCYKLLEGLFIPQPTVVDYLSFSHGIFQQLITNPRPIVIFKENTIESQLLYVRAKSMIEDTKSEIIEITSELPPPWNIFEYEATLNHLALKGIEKWSIDQIAWPGKSLDHNLYDIQNPQS